ncbi:hypothetical protein MGALJ_49580 [Mycobacterium gallinarum]|uniref:Cellulose synthase n=2 Tax=Mycobacterium gallinarum TaxID=39689 RepID=A0A9W4FHK9_9MYCO|nr:hypothetical protein MGALJ_49580 [Mycobacterium gallinarum]
MVKKLLLQLVSVALLVTLGAMSPAVGTAQPEVTAVPTEETPPLSMTWEQLGMGPTIGFTAANSAQTVTIPVPDGTQPRMFFGELQSIVNVTGGYIEITGEDGSLLGSVPIPDVTLGQVTVPFAIDISRLTIHDQAARMNIVLRQVGADPICGSTPNVTMNRLSVEFTGPIVLPTTIDQFFPPLLSGIDVYVDPAPTTSESQAVVTLAALLTHHYRDIPVDFRVLPLSRTVEPPAEWNAMRRTIVVRDDENDEGGGAVTVSGQAGVPYLLVTGKGDSLVDQTALFRSQLLAISQTPTAAIDSTESLAVRGTNTATFEQLGAGGRVTVLGQSSLYTGFDTAVFGLANPGKLDVHMLAHYTSVKDTEKGTLVVRSGGQALYSTELNESGLVDATFAVPGDLGSRGANLELAVTYEPAPGACNPRTVPMTFEIDDASTVTAVGGNVSMGGFEALPVGFAPTFQVALGGYDTNYISRAVAVIASVQKLTSRELLPTLVDVKQAANSGSGALIVADSATIEGTGLEPPIAPEKDAVEVDLPPDVTARIPEGLGSMQAFADNDRTVLLVTTSGDWSLVNPVFDFLATRKGGWRELRGDVVVAGAGGVAKNITVRSNGPALRVVETSNRWVLWALIGAGTAVVASIIAAVALTRRRKARKASVGQHAAPGFDSSGP